MQDHSRQATTVRRPREISGRMVLICFVGFFGVVAAVNFTMVSLAVSTFGGVETRSSYAAGLVFAKEVTAANAQDARHWIVKADIVTAGGARKLSLTARDAANAPLPGLGASVRLVHPADRRLDRELVMTEAAAGRFTSSEIPSAGQWDIVVELDRKGERMFRSRNRIVLH